MSDLTEQTTRLNFEEAIARIERAQAETRKFVAEQAKLNAEQTKFGAEQAKLNAEAAKLRLDRFLAPALALAATLGAIAALAPAILRALAA